MPSADRYWRRGLWIGIGMGAVPVAFIVTSVIVSILAFGETFFQAVASHDVWLMVGILLFSRWLIGFALEGRWREQLRARDLGGMQSLMLPAALQTHPEDAPDVSREPLQLLWLADHEARTRVRGLVTAFGIIALVVAVGVGILAIVFLAYAQFWPAAISLLVVIIAGLVVRWWWKSRHAHGGKGSGVNGVIATETCLTWRRPGKSDVSIEWPEARLLEIWRTSMGGGSNFAGYALFSEQALVEWRDYPQDRAPAAYDGSLYSEMQRRQRALLDLIAARTGLSPRTFANELAAPEEVTVEYPATRRPIWRRFSVEGVLLLLLLAAIPLAVAVAALALPLTTSPVLNAYAAVTTGALGLFLLGFEVKFFAGMFKDHPLPASHGTLPLILPAASIISGGEPLGVRAPFRWKERILAVIIGLVFAGDIYPWIRTLGDFQAAFTGHDDQTTPHSLLAGGLALIILVVVMCAWMTAFGRRWRVVTDEHGLHWRSGKEQRTLPWSAITRLSVSTLGGKIVEYEAVAGDVNRTKISWSADARWVRDGRAQSADRPAEVLAAVVEQRTGCSFTSGGAAI